MGSVERPSLFDITPNDNEHLDDLGKDSILEEKKSLIHIEDLKEKFLESDRLKEPADIYTHRLIPESKKREMMFRKFREIQAESMHGDISCFKSPEDMGNSYDWPISSVSLLNKSLYG